MKRRYNVDENRVVVSGVSDGGTGAYYVAMRDTTPFASFLPLNGYWMVLASRDIDDGEIFANNLRNKPLFIGQWRTRSAVLRRASSIRTSSTTRRAASRSTTIRSPRPDTTRSGGRR